MKLQINEAGKQRMSLGGQGKELVHKFGVSGRTVSKAKKIKQQQGGIV